MSFQINASPQQRKAGRFIWKVRHEIQKAYSEEKAAGNTNQSKLAQKLGIGRSVVSRRLRGVQNMTLRSIAEMAWGLDREIVFELRKNKIAAGANNIATGTSQSPTAQAATNVYTKTSSSLEQAA